MTIRAIISCRDYEHEAVTYHNEGIPRADLTTKNPPAFLIIQNTCTLFSLHSKIHNASVPTAINSINYIVFKYLYYWYLGEMEKRYKEIQVPAIMTNPCPSHRSSDNNLVSTCLKTFPSTKFVDESQIINHTPSGSFASGGRVNVSGYLFNACRTPNSRPI